MELIHENREDYLTAGAGMIRTDIFRELAINTVPFRIAVGIPGGGSSKCSATLGVTYPHQWSADGTTEMFINPKHHLTPCEIFETVTHELCHHEVGTREKHGKVFKHLAVAVGLEGKMTSTHAGDVLRGQLEKIVDKLGAYPGALLTDPKEGKILRDADGNIIKPSHPKQTTRMIKVECGCGNVARQSRKSNADFGLVCGGCLHAMLPGV